MTATARASETQHDRPDDTPPASWRRIRLGDHLLEVAAGVGAEWRRYRVVGATRGGLAPAKEAVGKAPERYKPVFPRTIFYNPMRILIGSIAMIDDGEEPGITSPDYVVFTTNPDVVHHRWFYYWLRSPWGEDFIRTLARGAVRERMLFRRLADAEVDVPPILLQQAFAEQVSAIESVRTASRAQLAATATLPVAILRAEFQSKARCWPRQPLRTVATLLPSKSIAVAGDTEVTAITTACLTETGFDAAGVKSARMWADDAAECVVAPGEVLVARSNTPELVGRAAMYEGSPSNVVASDLTIRIWPRDGLSSAFIAGYLSFLYATGYWRERAGGASGTMKKITRTQLQQESVPVPTPAEQERVVTHLCGQMAFVTRARKALTEQLAATDCLVLSLLRGVLSGES